jgi:TonB family protein
MNPTLKCDVVVEFIIDYKGQVKTAHIIRSSMYSKKIENCITSRIRGWRFKPIDQKEGDVKVRQKYLFAFTQQ